MNTISGFSNHKQNLINTNANNLIYFTTKVHKGKFSFNNLKVMPNNPKIKFSIGVGLCLIFGGCHTFPSGSVTFTESLYVEKSSRLGDLQDLFSAIW